MPKNRQRWSESKTESKETNKTHRERMRKRTKRMKKKWNSLSERYNNYYASQLIRLKLTQVFISTLLFLSARFSIPFRQFLQSFFLSPFTPFAVFVAILLLLFSIHSFSFAHHSFWLFLSVSIWLWFLSLSLHPSFSFAFGFVCTRTNERTSRTLWRMITRICVRIFKLHTLVCKF